MEKTMEIRQIKMASCRQDVIILGELSSGNFQYESSIVINTSDLNRLINLLQKGNPSDEISAMFTSTDFYDIQPKRTRWFNNILKARERAAGGTGNPNGQAPNNGNNQ